MSPLRRAFARLAAVAALGCVAPSAHAADAGELGGKPVTIDVTNTAIGAYHFDNRNTQIGLAPLTRLDDNYGEFLDRLNVQLGWWRLRAGVRIDTALYFHVPSNEKLLQIAGQDADDLRKRGQDPGSLNDRANRFYGENNTRLLQTYYPSKLFLSYTQPGVDVTVGDFYAQLGRGLVFSVRKIDELAIDTTVRGGKLVVDHDFDGIQVGLTAFAGQMNPLRVDEASGRRLNGSSSPLFFGFPQGRQFQTWDTNTPTGQPVSGVDAARPNYLEDSVYGGHVEVGNKVARLGGNASLLRRQTYTEQNLACTSTCGNNDQCRKDCAARYPDFSAIDASRLHNTIRTFSGSLSFPSIAKLGDAYVEIAGQQLRDGHVGAVDGAGNATTRTEDLSGYAVYASVSFRKGPLSLSLEGKHNRSFFPLAANIDTATPGFAAPEFSVIGYNQVPTVEPIYVEQIGSPNNCITGGRARVDYRFTPSVMTYGWVGRYTSFSEIDATNNHCDKKIVATGQSATQTNTWDTGVGSELRFDHGRSHAFAWIGARLSDRDLASDANAAGLTDTFYREGYIRYDLMKHLTGPFSLQMQGFHRHRYEPQPFADPWNEGENYTALQYSPHFSAIFGYEYLAKAGCHPSLDPAQPDTKLCHYFNGGLQWRSAQSDSTLKHLFDTVSLFVGQRRGAIRCVSGVCRQFPPFEGARLEIVSRF